jgi:hypothetical protein
MGLAIAVCGRDDLVKRFALANQAQVRTSALLGSFETFLEVNNFSVERGIARTELFVQSALLRYGGAQIDRFAIAIIGKPQFTLQSDCHNAKYDEHPAH